MENAPFQVLMMDLAYTEIVIQRDSPWAPKYAIVKVCVTYTPDGLHVLTEQATTMEWYAYGVR